MNRKDIAKIIYEELCYMYCNNCRYNSEIGEDDPNFGCDDCHRKYNGWGISMAEANRIAEMIGSDVDAKGDLISRVSAIERFCELGTSLERQGKTMITMVDAKYAFIKTLESLPSVESYREDGEV